MPSWTEFSELPARMRRKTAEVGPLYALQLIFWEIFPGWLIDLNVWIVTATQMRVSAAQQSHDAGLRWAGKDDVEALIRCGLDRAKIAAGLEPGCKIAVFERGGRIVAYARYGTAPYEQDDWLRFSLMPHDVYGAGMWVAPDYRGKGIAAQLIAFVWSHFVAAGCRRSLGIINVLNRNSRQACAKAGVTEAGRIFYLRLLGMAYLRYGSINRVGRWTPEKRLEILLAH